MFVSKIKSNTRDSNQVEHEEWDLFKSYILINLLDVNNWKFNVFVNRIKISKAENFIIFSTN